MDEEHSILLSNIEHLVFEQQTQSFATAAMIYWRPRAKMSFALVRASSNLRLLVTAM